MLLLLVKDAFVVDEPADGEEEMLELVVLVVVVVVLAFERLDEADTERFIAGEPALGPAPGPQNAALDINAEAD